MRKATVCFAGAAALALGGGADAALYTWTGGGSNNNWTTCGNWNYTEYAPFCYPRLPDDIAAIESSGAPATIAIPLIDHFSELVIFRSVTFTKGGEVPKLRFGRATICNDSFADLVIELEPEVTLEAVQP
ncbi:hypothetical protein RAS1_03980 [Phycisphaerae bacterium RAS1]|nr:hypothetical protein RAS1_03980 [Phycisphaerae bacterium RAS1]